MTKPRFELGTHTVLRCCHNQLDHSAGYILSLDFLFIQSFSICLYSYIEYFIFLNKNKDLNIHA